MSWLSDKVFTLFLCVNLQSIDLFSIDNFIKTILEYRHQALEPILLNENDLFTLNASPDTIYSLFYIHGYAEILEYSSKYFVCLVRN